MSVPVIKIENLQKNYRIGEIGTGTLSQDLNRFWAKIRGKADPFEKVGLNDRTQKAQKGEIISALRNVSLSVDRGEVLGIIGKNGAGKSTLLKILSRVTAPTSGKIRIRGRMASLLEIGTGFHTEMTGRENIYMNGTIMGMRKWEITKKLDEIVEFAGVAKYLDTPTKRYSSGMTVRLGFAVAAFLEPEILVVDEVLAVGDAEFQSKAIGKMQDVSKDGGRTVLFVSHNLMSIRKLCDRVIHLEKGSIINEGSVDKVIDDYLKVENFRLEENSASLQWEEKNAPGDHQAKLLSIELKDNEGNLKNTFQTSEQIFIVIQLRITQKIAGARIVVHILTEEEEVIFSTTDQLSGNSSYEQGKHTLTCKIPSGLLNQRKYKVRMNMTIPNVCILISPRIFFAFQVVLTSSKGIGFNKEGYWPGIIAPNIEWERQLIK